MNINNLDLIISLYNQNLQGIFNIFIDDIKEMIFTEQLNINSAEDLMNVFVKNIKGFLTSIIGDIFSNINPMNDSNVIYDKGIQYKRIKKNVPISILTSHGEVTFERDYYFSRSHSKGFGETDKLLEISNIHRVSKGVIEEITFAGQKNSSFKEASETLKRYLNLDINETQIEIISQEVGRLIFDKDMEISEGYSTFQELKENTNKQNLNSVKDDNSVLYVFADGSMISMIGKNNWKEMKLGLVLNKEDVSMKNFENMQINKKEYISYLGNKEMFAQALYGVAKRAGLNEHTKVIALGDGAPWIWDMFDTLFPGCTKILDFYHFKENVNEYAKWVFQTDEVGCKRFVNKIIELADKNSPEDILKELDNLDVDVEKRPTGVVNLPNYILEKKDKINYGEYKEKGYIIGSGAIESGNKVVIQQRLKQSGMHWSIEGAQYIATLRTKYKSNLWDVVIKTIFEEYMVS